MAEQFPINDGGAISYQLAGKTWAIPETTIIAQRLPDDSAGLQ